VPVVCPAQIKETLWHGSESLANLLQSLMQQIQKKKEKKENYVGSGTTPYIN